MMDIYSMYEYKSVFLILMTLIMGGFTAIRFSYSNIFATTYNLRSFFSLKSLEDAGSNMRLLSTENVFITLLLSAIISFCTQVYLYFSLAEPQQFFYIGSSTGWTILLNWLLMIVMVSLYFVLKYLFIVLIGWLFDFPDHLSGHFKEYQSIGHSFYFIFGITSAVAVVAFTNLNSAFIKVMLIILGIFQIYRILLISLRLYRKSHFSIFYIFSYICSTEIIPLVLFLSFVFE